MTPGERSQICLTFRGRSCHPGPAGTARLGAWGGLPRLHPEGWESVGGQKRAGKGRMGTSGGQVPGVRVGRELAENQVRGHKQGHRWKAMNSNHHKGPCPGAWGRGALRLQRPGHALQMPSFVGKQAWHQGAWKLSLQATQGGSCVTITEVPRGTVAGHKGKVRASTRSAGKELSAKGIRHPGVGWGRQRKKTEPRGLEEPGTLCGRPSRGSACLGQGWRDPPPPHVPEQPV